MSASVGSIAIAINAQGSGNPGEQWVHLLPQGAFTGRDGRGPWTIPDPAAFISATARRQSQALPVDYEHQTDYATQNGQPAPAAGWIKELAPRADGIWGRIEWTAKAAAHLASREYRFISPVFNYHPTTGEATALLRAGLTNVPNLELTALARAQHGAAMDEIDELRQLLGLDEEAKLSDIVTGVRSLVGTMDGQAMNRPDPTRFVPMDVFQQVTAQLNLRNQGMSEEVALNRVELAMSQGKILPFLKDWAVSICTVSPTAFDEFMAKTGDITGTFAKTLSTPAGLDRKPPSSVSRLSPAEAQVAKALGHSEEEFIAANRSRTP